VAEDIVVVAPDGLDTATVHGDRQSARGFAQRTRTEVGGSRHPASPHERFWSYRRAYLRCDRFLGVVALGSLVFMDWWETFFDEDYVEAWTAAESFQRTADQAEAIERLLDPSPGAEILDVPCGFGRIAKPLHDRGYRVMGIDASDAQLRLAQERNPGPTYLHRDMRRPPVGPYDAVINFFSSFGYFEERSDDIAALEAWFRVLRHGGVLLMELMHRDGVAHLYDPDDKPVEHGRIREAGRTDWITGVRDATVTYGSISKSFRIRLYTATELVGELKRIGFSTVEVWGDLDGVTPLSPATRLVIRATR
jgi:SAM-dependent methyltransferase